MTSDIAIKPKRTTACYDMPSRLIEIVRKISAELDVPQGDVIAFMVSFAMAQNKDEISWMDPARVASMTRGRHQWRLRIR